MPPGGGVATYGGPGVGSGTVSSPAPAPKPIEGVKCLPVPPRKECCSDRCALAKANRKDVV